MPSGNGHEGGLSVASRGWLNSVPAAATRPAPPPLRFTPFLTHRVALSQPVKVKRSQEISAKFWTKVLPFSGQSGTGKGGKRRAHLGYSGSPSLLVEHPVSQEHAT